MRFAPCFIPLVTRTNGASAFLDAVGLGPTTIAWAVGAPMLDPAEIDPADDDAVNGVPEWSERADPKNT